MRVNTGNVCFDGEGIILGVHVINTGRTIRSNPVCSGDPAFCALPLGDKFLFGYTPNHWANLEEQQKFTLHCYKRIIAQWAARKGVTEEVARVEAKALWSIDCWPVHTSDAYRTWMAQHTPGFEIQYIPAGRTGDKQINDTHLHFPMKAHLCRAASTWYMKKLREYRALRDSAALDDSEFHARLNKLMSMRVLRDRFPYWLRDALVKTTRQREDGTQLLREGWETIYFQPSSVPGFLAEALAAAEARRKQAEDAKLAAAIAAAAAAAAVAAAGGMGAADAAAAGLAAAAHEPQLPALPDAVMALAAAEKAYHVWEEPVVQPAPIKAADLKKARASKKLKRLAQRREDMEEEYDMDEQISAAVALKADNQAAAAAAKGAARVKVGAVKLAELRVQLKALGCPTGGNKADLIERLRLKKQDMGAGGGAPQGAPEGAEAAQPPPPPLGAPLGAAAAQAPPLIGDACVVKGAKRPAEELEEEEEEEEDEEEEEEEVEEDEGEGGDFFLREEKNPQWLLHDLVNGGGGNLATARSQGKIEKIRASIALIKPALMAHRPKPLAARAERWTELEAEFDQELQKGAHALFEWYGRGGFTP